MLRRFFRRFFNLFPKKKDGKRLPKKPPPKDDFSTMFQFFDKCPDCGCLEFYFGPEGGMSTNVMCSECKSAFNAVPTNNMMGFGWAHRISNSYWMQAKGAY